MKKGILIFFTVLSGFCARAQSSQFFVGEFGVTVGAAHYFGDLNPNAAIDRPKPALGIFYLKQFNNYLGMRVSAHFAQLGYSDTYSDNTFQKLRNLSFNTNIWELAVHGDFNFFKFVPGDEKYFFTPFITIGVGIFTYDPYAYIDGRKVYLRELGTEGQNINYKDANGITRTPYSSMAFCFPVGIGFKYNINNKLNLSFQVIQRLTNTDYLDDVSTTYVGTDKFPTLPNGQFSDAGLLQDRSFEKGALIGVEGRQRGWSKQKDQYIMAEVGLSFTLSDYRCPSY